MAEDKKEEGQQEQKKTQQSSTSNSGRKSSSEGISAEDLNKILDAINAKKTEAEPTSSGTTIKHWFTGIRGLITSIILVVSMLSVAVGFGGYLDSVRSSGYQAG